MRSRALRIVILFIFLPASTGNGLLAQSSPTKRDAGSTLVLAQQDPGDFKIISPTDGAIVHPGQILDLQISATPGKVVKEMFIISPLGSAPVSDSPPYRAALQIPRSDEPGLAVLGRQNVTLVGRSSGKQSPILASIFVDVEKQDLPVSLESDFRHIFFRELGETVHSPRIVGRWADSSSFNLQASSYLALRSSDPALFSLDDRGNMTALAPGKGELYATYFLGSQKVSLAIPVTLPTQILRALPSSFNFGLVELGKASIPIDVVLTNVSGAPQELLTLRLSPIFTETDDCAIPTTLGPGKSCTFTIRWSPKSRSEMGGAMEIALTTGIMKVYLSGSPGDHLP